MLGVVKCLYKYCDKKMSITHPVHFISVFAVNIHVSVAQLSVSQVLVFLYNSRCMGIIIIAFIFCAVIDPCSCLCVNTPVADLEGSY